MRRTARQCLVFLLSASMICPVFASDTVSDITMPDTTVPEKILAEPETETGSVSQWYSANSNNQEETETAVRESAPETEVQWYVAGTQQEEKTEEEKREELIAQIEKEEAASRRERERILRLKASTLLDDEYGALSDDDPVCYVTTDDDVDYLVVMHNGMSFVYYVYISKQGDYFISSDGMTEEEKNAVLPLATSETFASTERFWNKVTLMYTEGATISSLPRDQFGVLCVPYFNQGAGYWTGGTWEYTDWPNTTFNVNGHTMHEAGCGFFSTAMALSYIQQQIIAPIDFKENGQYIAGDGAAVTVGVESAKMYGISAYMTSDINEVITALQNGHPVMEHVGPSIFTNYGHYIMLVGVLPDGTIAVNDPGHKDNTYWYCGVSHSVDTITRAAKDQPSYTIFG